MQNIGLDKLPVVQATRSQDRYYFYYGDDAATAQLND